MSDPSYLRFQEVGQKALQEKQFKAATKRLDQAFLRASQTCGNHSSVLNGILDLRVEAYIGLKQYDAALRDAHSMIRYDRADPRGYLRCGQLCRLKNDYPAAQKWYEQGLKKTPETNKHYATLQAMSSKAATRLRTETRSKFRDPFIVLPMDIIHMLTEHLDFRQAVTCLRVSKTWHNTLLAIPAIWKTFDLLETRKKITKPDLKACLRRLKTPPTTLRLGNLTDTAVAYFRRYMKRWETIEHLNINVPGLVKFDLSGTLPVGIKTLHVGDQCSIPFRVVNEILHLRHILQRVRFDAVTQLSQEPGLSASKAEVYRSNQWKTSLPELTHLALNAGAGLSGNWVTCELPPLFGDFPNLTVLQCRGLALSDSNADLSTARRLRHLSLENSSINVDFRLPSSLEVLICRSCVHWLALHPPWLPSPEEAHQDFETLAQLKCLELDSFESRPPHLFTMARKSLAPTLTKLAICSKAMEIATLMTFFESGNLAKLIYLGLYEWEMDDDHIQRISSQCPMLEYAEFRGLRITGVAVKELCLRTAVKTLQLTSCYNISADAIDWARAKNVTVIMQGMSEDARLLGRRVRYG